MLIVCFSDLSGDARVLKQIRAFAGLYQLTTCGFGPTPDPRVEHIRLDPDAPVDGRFGRLLLPRIDAALSRAGVFAWTYRRIPYVREAMRRLRGRRFDVALADDVDAIAPALRAAGRRRVHADLHEYFPGLHDGDATELARRQTAYLSYLVRRYATRAASVTTVAAGIAAAYTEVFGIHCRVVTNATPRADLAPRPTGLPIRLVHSGNAQPSRQLEMTMRAAAETRTNLTLDLLLVPNDLAYLARLRELAEDLGPRVRILPPVPQRDLVATLNTYDVGVHVLPASSFNNRHALPNKFFDYVQARLGVIIGPSPEMARILETHGFGAVAGDFSVPAVREVFDALTPDGVAAWKARADSSAGELSADAQIEIWVDAVERLLATG